VATSSKALAAGALVPYVRAGVGAVASQSFVNPYLGIDGLALLQDGVSAADALDRLIASDNGRNLRQAAVIDLRGGVAAYTGSQCIAWAGHLSGDGYVCLGNILAGEAVIQAMCRAFEDSAAADLSERLVLTLEAGQGAGGDRRGRQSAGLLVTAEEEYPLCDLRVDDHEDPIPELRRVYQVYKEEELPFLRMMPRRTDFTPHWDEVGRVHDEVISTLESGVPTTKES
jgi:uncharacterized Ntn-hydrolase superfamily protein